MTQKLLNKLKGTGVAIVTPFTKNKVIDFPAFENLLEFIIKGGVDYVVLMGTTGESATLSRQEKKTLIEFAVTTIMKRVPLVLGIGGNNTSDVVLTIHGTAFRGIDAVLSVCPYYNKPQQDGLYLHFMTIAEACPVPVILYNVPGRTGCNMTAQTTLRLASDSKNIIGIKEASGSFDQIGQIIRDRPVNFLVISGDDGITLPLLAMGADGVISVVANAFPREFSEMVKLGLKGDFEKARKIHYRLTGFMAALFADGSPAGVKAALSIKKICRNELRLPLVPVKKEIHSQLKKRISEI